MKHTTEEISNALQNNGYPHGSVDTAVFVEKSPEDGTCIYKCDFFDVDSDSISECFVSLNTSGESLIADYV